MPETIAHFQLLELLGRGALGELHRARDLQHGRTVALRILSPAIAGDQATRGRLLDVAGRAANASHPALAAVFECGDAAGQMFMATEFVPGQRLSALVSGSPINPQRAIALAVQMADGLAVAHAHGLVHGALDADAVIVTPKGAVKILDTGMTDLTAPGATAVHLSALSAGAESGVDGTDAIDLTAARSEDVAELGALLFQMLVGRRLERGWPGELRTPQLPDDLRPILMTLTTTGENGLESMATAAALLRDVESRLPLARSGSGAASAAEERGLLARAAPILIAGFALAALAWLWLTLP